MRTLDFIAAYLDDPSKSRVHSRMYLDFSKPTYRLSVRNGTLFSYALPIAKLTPAGGCVYVHAHKNSVTTNRHIYGVRRLAAARGIAVYNTPDIPTGDLDRAFLTNTLVFAVDQALEHLARAQNTRRSITNRRLSANDYTDARSSAMHFAQSRDLPCPGNTLPPVEQALSPRDLALFALEGGPL
jgi:hypothetical protein